jgi:hypothetical protein
MSEHADSADSQFARGPWKPFEPGSHLQIASLQSHGGLSLVWPAVESESGAWRPLGPPTPEREASKDHAQGDASCLGPMIRLRFATTSDWLRPVRAPTEGAGRTLEAS